MVYTKIGNLYKFALIDFPKNIHWFFARILFFDENRLNSHCNFGCSTIQFINFLWLQLRFSNVFSPTFSLKYMWFKRLSLVKSTVLTTTAQEYNNKTWPAAVLSPVLVHKLFFMLLSEHKCGLIQIKTLHYEFNFFENRSHCSGIKSSVWAIKKLLKTSHVCFGPRIV